MAPHNTLAVAVSFWVASSGCISQDLESEPLGIDQSALVSDNALNPNALNPNALNPNALNPNALNPNALNPNALAPSALAAIQDAGDAGVLSRALLKYIVSCALDTSQSFSFSWTDSQGVVHDESYPGLLGIATSWATGALSADMQLFVSSCLAARVNWYGVPVIISARSLKEPLKALVNDIELQDYPHIEGAFWGNLFTTSPHLYSCYNGANVENSRTWQRDCAVGHLDGQTLSPCGMISLVGDCSTVCQNVNGAGQYYPSCREAPFDPSSSAMTKFVITAGLP